MTIALILYVLGCFMNHKLGGVNYLSDITKETDEKIIIVIIYVAVIMAWPLMAIMFLLKGK